MTKTQIKSKFKDLSISRLRLYLVALTELLHEKLIAEKVPIYHKEDARQITIEEAIAQISGGGRLWEI